MVNVEKKQRNSNLELYRILLMLGIIAHHYVVNTGVLGIISSEPLTIKSLFFYLFGMWGKIGINCFVMITGFFMCKSSISVRKFLKLLLEIEFYKLTIYLLFVFTGYIDFSLKEFLWNLNPIQSVSDGFVSCFLIFYLCIPFLNMLISHLDKKMHLQLVALCLGIYTVLGTLPVVQVRMNYVSWFCTLYVVASYLRFYPVCFKSIKIKWGGCLLLSICFSIASVVCSLIIKSKFGMQIGCYRYVSDCNMIFALTTGVTAFMYFKDVKMKHSKMVNCVGQSVFGVLLIHANSDVMRQWLWSDTLNVTGMYYSDYACVYALCAVILIFCVCIVIDYVRIHTFERWFFTKIDKLIK